MSIKIVICLIIILPFLPAASAGTAYDVWAARSSGFIKSNESVSFENYQVRAKVLDNTKATLTVYKGKAQLETSDFNINDFKKYDDVGVTLLGIRGDYSWVSISKLENKEFWRPITRTRLKWGEKYTIENYTINIDIFGNDSVNLTITNKSMVGTEVFSTGSSKDYETLRIAVRDINRTGFVDFEFLTNKPPVFKTDILPFIKAQILTDKDEYFPDEPIQVSVKISSDFTLNTVGIIVESSPAVGIQQDNFSATGVLGTQSFQSRITGQPANSTVTISAKIEVRDYNNGAYTIDVDRDIPITPVVSIIKSAPMDADDETVPVQLYVYNSETDNKTIYVRDTVPAELGAKELNWTIELGPKNTTILEYNLAPKKPGQYFLPIAAAQWDGQSAVSRRVKMTMHMPYISIVKTAEYNQSETLVKLISTNTGDRPAQVKVSDKILAGFKILKGDRIWEGKLEGGKSATIVYSLEGNVDYLPAAGATYQDIRGVARQAQSNAVDLKAGNSNEAVRPDRAEEAETTIPLNVGPSEIVTFMVSSFLAISGIITGGALIAYLINLARR